MESHSRLTVDNNTYKMKFFAVVLLVAQTVLIQNACGQVIRAAPSCSSYGSAIIAQPSVANSLADTLSLLTVSSLLAETLPLNPNIIAAVPAPVVAPTVAPAISYGGCGCGSGYRNYYNYLY